MSAMSVTEADLERVRRDAAEVKRSIIRSQINRLRREARPLLFIGMGQSNMLGSNNDAAGPRVGTNPNVKMFHWIGQTNLDGGNNQWVDSQPGFGPMNSGHATPNNVMHNLGIRAYEETGCPVNIVMKAHGSTSVNEWTTSHTSYDRFLSIDAHIQAGLNTPEMKAANKTQADLWAWLQGSNDTNAAGSSKEIYKGKWTEVYGRVKASSWFPEDGPVVISQLPQNTIYSDRNDAFDELAGNENPYVSVARSDGLQVDSSIAHYTGASLAELGYNIMFDAWMLSLASRAPETFRAI